MKSNATDKPETLAKREPRSGLLIIGYGNPLRGDDGIGWKVVHQLAKLAGDSTTVLAVHQLTPELAEPIGEASLIIFIDACYEGQPGSWTCETIHPGPKPLDAYTHYFTPMNLLSYTQAMYGASPNALLISVAGSSFDCGEELSPRVEAIVPEIVACAQEWWNAGVDRFGLLPNSDLAPQRHENLTPRREDAKS